MKPKYCDDEELRRWNLGPGCVCNGEYDHCIYVIKFGKQEYCGWTPLRVAIRDTIRSQGGCLFCRHTHNKLSSSTCSECLSAETRIYFDDERTV